MGFGHKHTWKQIRDVFISDKKTGDILGVYFYCEDCHALHSRTFKGCNNWGFEEKKGDN